MTTPQRGSGTLGGGSAAPYASAMPSDSSNARDALGDATGDKQQPAATSIDPDEEGKALLSDLTVGSVVDGKYRVDQVLGRGAMGVVVAATHLQLGEKVAFMHDIADIDEPAFHVAVGAREDRGLLKGLDGSRQRQPTFGAARRARA